MTKARLARYSSRSIQLERCLARGSIAARLALAMIGMLSSGSAWPAEPSCGPSRGSGPHELQRRLRFRSPPRRP